MNWLNKYKPKCLNDFQTNNTEILKAKAWIESYKKDYTKTKKVLLILGATGIGKTTLADILFKEYGYQKIELNSTDIRSQKKIGEFLKKSLTYKNVVDMFYEGNNPIGILLDEIDTISKLSDKGGFTEFLSILKQNEKFENLKNDKKKKVKKTFISVDDYVKLYNPIICTSNDLSDKKINELKKYAEVINLQKSSHKENFIIIEKIYSLNNKHIDDDLKMEISNYCQGDVRRLIIILESLYFYGKESLINKELFENFKKSDKEKEENIQLLESTRTLITKKIPIQQTAIYFDVDCLLTPLMLYHNSLDFIKNSEDNSKKKLNVYRNVLESLCIHDTIQTSIFEVQDWDELYDIASIYGSAIPNYYFNELSNKKDVKIEFTSLLNKISQMYVNKKLLNGAKFSIGKLNYDTDEIIFLTEIMSYYFDNYKDNLDNKSNDLEEDDEDEEDEEEEDAKDEEDAEDAKDAKDAKDASIKINSSNINLINNNDLIKFMNNYNINIDGLENLLKIEKINKINEKRKKKFTLKIKKDISNFLVNKIT